MIKMKTSIAIFLTLFSISVLAAANSKNEVFDWRYSSEGSYSELDNVTFINGAELSHLKTNPDDIFGQKIILKSSDTSQNKTIFEDSIAKIIAPFSGNTAAKFAVVYHTCNGSACNEVPTYLILPEGETLQQYFISDYSFKLDIKYSASKLISAKATNVYFGKNSYGDWITGTLVFLENKGFVDSRMKNYYKRLIHTHPGEYLNDKFARASLVKLTGAAGFRKLREAMVVSSDSQSRVVNNSFLVLTGCMPHRCGDTFAIIVINTVNDDVWYFYIEDKKYQAAGSRKVESSEIFNMRNIFESIREVGGFKLSIDNEGLPIIKTN